MVFWKALEISKTKTMRPSADEIAMIMQRERVPDAGAYDTMTSTPSSKDDNYAHVFEYKSYWFSILVVFTLKDILGLSIFLFGGNKEHKIGALNGVDVAIFS